MSMKGKVAFITGAGSGIGRAAALRLAKEGVRVVASGRTEPNLKETVAAIEKAGGEGIASAADVADAKAMEQAINEVVKQWGRLDIVFANAGINGVWAPLEELAVEEWNKTVSINLTGTYHTVKFAVPYLKKQGGSIIITSSVNGTRMFSNTGASAYATTKAGQVAFCKMIALELAEHRVRANVICPGAIETNIDENTERRDLETVQEPVEFPEGKVPLTDGEPGSAEQVADLVYFLASDLSSHITGTEIWIDGAQSLLQG